MKEIKLIRLEMENFKCFRHLRLDFNGRNAEISGENATGKTSVYDSLMWLLFSKNSNGIGDKNFEVKPLGSDGNVVDHDALTAVEAVFQVSGEDLTLRRTYREKWETKRGSSDAVYTGNTSEYYINGVPVKRNGFQDKVNELVDEDTFRLLTNTSYFAAGISWQERREILFQVAGVMDDQQILATSAQFAPLVESMGKLNLEDYKKKLLSEKKKFTGAKTEIPARISECQKTIEDVQNLDFAGAKAEVEVLNARKEQLEAQIVAIEHDSAADQKRLELREAQLELTALYNENKAYRASQSVNVVDTSRLRYDLSNLNARKERLQKSMSAEHSYITDCERRIALSREKWISVNGDIFTGVTCVTCGQTLPADKLQKAKDAFEARKQKELREIEEGATSYKNAKAQAEARLASMQEELQQIRASVQELKNQIADAEANTVIPQDMEHYAENAHLLNEKISRLNDQLSGMMMDSSAAAQMIRDEKREVQAAINKQMDIISKEGLLAYSRDRIKDLRTDAKNAAECLEAIEKMLYLMEVYSRYKTRFVEDSINGMFRIARFRLFREQANGGVEDRCDVVYDGIAYENLNNGMKINLGIDIINTLSVAYGVRVPLFVDNVESVTNLEHCGSQVIRLRVKNEKELSVHYEN